MPETAEKTYTYRFRLKGGSHHDKKRKLTIETGQIFDTDQDMAKLHGRERWERLKTPADVAKGATVVEEKPTEEPYLESTEDELDGKSIKELRALAAEKEIDISTCSGKEQIIQVIRTEMDAA